MWHDVYDVRKYAHSKHVNAKSTHQRLSGCSGGTDILICHLGPYQSCHYQVEIIVGTILG